MKKTTLEEGLKRLLKLAEHLESDKLGVDKFNFNHVFQITDCGTVGCALGCCPTVFPEDWQLRNKPVLCSEKYGARTTSIRVDASNFFAISLNEVWALFYPKKQHRIYYITLPELDTAATPKQVAANIRKFVAWNQKQQNQ